jgi:hypothetical protein
MGRACSRISRSTVGSRTTTAPGRQRSGSEPLLDIEQGVVQFQNLPIDACGDAVVARALVAPPRDGLKVAVEFFDDVEVDS